MRTCVFVCIVLLTVAVAAHAGRGKEATAERIASLIRQLGDDEFKIREAASKALDAIGEPALGALRKATSDDDLEIRTRAGRIVRAITGRIRAAAAKKELEKLQGAWYTVSLTYKGTLIGGDKNDTITYEGNKFVERRNGQLW